MPAESTSTQAEVNPIKFEIFMGIDNSIARIKSLCGVMAVAETNSLNQEDIWRLTEIIEREVDDIQEFIQIIRK